jgi:hypothetical protein
VPAKKEMGERGEPSAALVMRFEMANGHRQRTSSLLILRVILWLMLGALVGLVSVVCVRSSFK